MGIASKVNSPWLRAPDLDLFSGFSDVMEPCSVWVAASPGFEPTDELQSLLEMSALGQLPQRPLTCSFGAALTASLFLLGFWAVG